MKDLSKYKALSFDCYGTLIDWETGLANVLRPWSVDVGLDLDDEQLLRSYAGHEAAVMRERPSALYPELLGEALRRTGDELGQPVSEQWAEAMGASVPDWPAFADSAEALAVLGQHYELIILSNVDRDGFAGSNKKLQGNFATIITAQDVGAYKPAAPHFEALFQWLRQRNIADDEVLHVAQSLFHDHVPAHQFGLDSVWINRRHDRPGWGATPEPEQPWSYDAQYTSMAELAAAVQQAHTSQG